MGASERELISHVVVVNTLCNSLLQLRRDQRARTTIEFSEVKPQPVQSLTIEYDDDEHLIGPWSVSAGLKVQRAELLSI